MNRASLRGQPFAGPRVHPTMATNTLIAPTDLIIETGVRATELVVRFADEHSARDAARFVTEALVRR